MNSELQKIQEQITKDIDLILETIDIGDEIIIAKDSEFVQTFRDIQYIFGRIKKKVQKS